MTRQQILMALHQHLAELRQRFGVEHLYLFGSVARDEATSKSDVDLLVDFGRAPTYRQYIGATLYLEDLLGCRVDLVSKGTLKAQVLPAVLQDRLEVVDAA